MNRFLKRLRALRRRRQLDRDLEDELRFHREMLAQEESPNHFGNPTLLKETCRDLWAFTWIETLWQDIRSAARTLPKSPVFTVIVVFALALGIGVNTVIYTVVSSALTFNIGAQEMDRLVVINAVEARGDPFPHSWAEYRDLRGALKSVQTLAAYRLALVSGSDSTRPPERFRCVQMSANGFAVAGSKPVLGRDFTAEDEQPGAPAVVMLAYHVWQNRYGKDPSILGKTVRVNDVPRVVIGVMPSKMQFPRDTELWTPLDSDLRRDAAPHVLLFGRLANGVSLQAARAEMDTIARRLQAKAPESYKGLIVDVQPFLNSFGLNPVRGVLIAVVCAVGFVLLIACADVANLMLARSATRAREISVRIALGATRARIVQHLLVESILLSGSAGLLGSLVALTGLRWFDAVSFNSTRPSWIDFSMNFHALGYLAIVSIGTGILFGVAPALRLAKVDVNNAVKDGGHGSVGSQRSQRLAGVLVVFEIVLCIVLLTGAGLTIRSAVNTYRAPIGVNVSNVLTMQIYLPEAKYPRTEDLVSFFRRLKGNLQSLPGVDAVSLVSSLPEGLVRHYAYVLEGQPPADPNHESFVAGLVVEADYFRVMQVPIRRGRVFNKADGIGAAPAVIVNESFAAKAWPGEDPLGKRFRWAPEGTPQHWLTVVGMVPDIQQNFQHPVDRAPMIYLSYAAEPQREMILVARTTVPPSSMGEPFRRELQRLDENLPVDRLRTLEQVIAQGRGDAAVLVTLFSIFAGVALLLAWAGLYGVVAHSVSQRTREIGVRMALGGTAGGIMRLVFWQGMRRIVIGLAIGLPLGVALTFALRFLLVGVAPGDPLSLAGAALVLILAGLLGCAIPARRAVRVDPIVALRWD
jgi:putative ABC transport system permease protein